MECPESAKYFDVNRVYFCDVCPNKKASDGFKGQTLEIITELFGEKESNKFKFEDYKRTLYAVINLQDLSKEKMSVKTNRLLSAYLNEKYRFERIEELEREASIPKS